MRIKSSLQVIAFLLVIQGCDKDTVEVDETIASTDNYELMESPSPLVKYQYFEQEKDSYAMGIKNAILILRKASNPRKYIGYVVDSNNLTDHFPPVDAYPDGVLYRIVNENVFITKEPGFKFRHDLLFDGQYAYQLIEINEGRNLQDEIERVFIFKPVHIFN